MLHIEKLHQPATISIKGYLASENETTYYIDDGNGVWVCSKDDVVRVVDWTPAEARLPGKAVVLFVQDGAEIQEIRRYRIDLRLAPLTAAREAAIELEQQGGPKGLDILRSLQEKWERHVGIGRGVAMRNPTTHSDQGGGDPPLHGLDDCGW